jgi:hypothetical protein
MTTRPSTIDQLLDYWPGNIPFKGKLVSNDGCMCAQGQALHFLKGLSVDELRCIHQDSADKQVAELLGISNTHSVLLRSVNDTQEGAPSSVIRNPEQVLGDQAEALLAFWWHLDRMTPAAWEAVAVEATARDKKEPWVESWLTADRVADRNASKAARKASMITKIAAQQGCRLGVLTAAKTADWAAGLTERLQASRAAAGASNEIQGAIYMRANNEPFFFLSLFGFSDPQAVIDASKTNSTC